MAVLRPLAQQQWWITYSHHNNNGSSGTAEPCLLDRYLEVNCPVEGEGAPAVAGALVRQRQLPPCSCLALEEGPSRVGCYRS